MEKDIEKFFNNAKNIRLSKSEKDEILRELRAFIWRHPLKTKTAKVTNGLRFLFTGWRVAVAAFVLIIVIGSAGTSTLASKALPGDVLYPVKTGVNEEIKTFFAFTDEAKAQVNASIAELRLKEAEKLAEDGKLDVETRTKLERGFKKRADSFEEELKKIEEKNKEDAAIEQSKVEDTQKELQLKQNTLEQTSEVSEKEAEVVNNEEIQKNSSAKEKYNKKKQKARELSNKFQEVLEAREKALEKFRNMGENIEEDDSEGIEPLLKEVRGRIKSKDLEEENED